MKHRLIGALLIGTLSSTAAHAACWGGGAYTQNLEGVYSQNWWVENVSSKGNGACSVVVKGEGKLGDFWGNLTIRCGYSPSWSWGAVQSDYLSKGSVPHQALVALSTSVCSGH